ncbi:hypothetical protein [Nocardia sp. NPDC050406]
MSKPKIRTFAIAVLSAACLALTGLSGPSTTASGPEVGSATGEGVGP